MGIDVLQGPRSELDCFCKGDSGDAGRRRRVMLIIPVDLLAIGSCAPSTMKKRSECALGCVQWPRRWTSKQLFDKSLSFYHSGRTPDSPSQHTSEPPHRVDVQFGGGGV